MATTVPGHEGCGRSSGTVTVLTRTPSADTIPDLRLEERLSAACDTGAEQ